MIDGFFLKAKHWQIFILKFGVVIVFQVVFVVSILKDKLDSAILEYVNFYPITILPIVIGYFGWLWAIGIELQKRCREDLRLAPKRFKVCFFIPLVHIIFIYVFFLIKSGSVGPMIGICVFGVHFLSIVCILYCLYFVAKVFKTITLKKEVKFNEFSNEFFLFWFFPIGIWVLQPKINELIKS